MKKKFYNLSVWTWLLVNNLEGLSMPRYSGLVKMSIHILLSCLFEMLYFNKNMKIAMKQLKKSLLKKIFCFFLLLDIWLTQV